jgi:hypothetical protein
MRAAIDARSDQFSFCVACSRGCTARGRSPGRRCAELMAAITRGKAAGAAATSTGAGVGPRGVVRGLHVDPSGAGPTCRRCSRRSRATRRGGAADRPASARAAGWSARGPGGARRRASCRRGVQRRGGAAGGTCGRGARGRGARGDRGDGGALRAGGRRARRRDQPRRVRGRRGSPRTRRPARRRRSGASSRRSCSIAAWPASTSDARPAGAGRRARSRPTRRSSRRRRRRWTGCRGSSPAPTGRTCRRACGRPTTRARRRRVEAVREQLSQARALMLAGKLRRAGPIVDGGRGRGGRSATAPLRRRSLRLRGELRIPPRGATRRRRRRCAGRTRRRGWPGTTSWRRGGDAAGRHGYGLARRSSRSGGVARASPRPRWRGSGDPLAAGGPGA